MALRAVQTAAGFFGLVLCFSGQLRADPPRANPHLEEAKALYKRLKYAEVPAKLERALQMPGNTDDQLCEIYELLGTVQVVLENEKAAVYAFERLLSINPDHRLGHNISPKIVGLFLEVKKRVVAPPRVAFVGKPRLFAAPRKIPRIEVELSDPSGAVSRVLLFVRSRRSARYRKIAMSPAGKNLYSADLPITSKRIPPGGLKCEYFLRALGKGRTPVAVLGDRASPKVLPIPPAPEVMEPPPPPPPSHPPAPLVSGTPMAASRPWYHQWWFWTAVGVAAVSLSVGIGIGLGGEGEIPVGSLGKLPLD